MTVKEYMLIAKALNTVFQSIPDNMTRMTIAKRELFDYCFGEISLRLRQSSNFNRTLFRDAVYKNKE